MATITITIDDDTLEVLESEITDVAEYLQVQATRKAKTIIDKTVWQKTKLNPNKFTVPEKRQVLRDKNIEFPPAKNEDQGPEDVPEDVSGRGSGGGLN